MDKVLFHIVKLLDWIQRFFNEQDSLEDNPRSGRPLSVVTQQNIDAVQDLVNDDLHISIDYAATI